MDAASSRLTADILAVCDTLGVSTGDTYFKDPQCLSSAKDLILYLRRDSTEHSTRRLLGESQIVQRDLIPIYKGEDCSEELAEVVLRLLVNLTTPALLLYDQGVPKDKIVQNHVIEMTRQLQAYKKAFADEHFWTVISGHLAKLLENIELILEVQKLTLERILILIRNVLHVPADPAEEMRNDDDANVHDQILWVMQKAGVLDLLLFIASSDSTREFCMHVVETLTLIFREQTGEQLAKTKLKPSREDILKDSQELGTTMRAEMVKRSQRPIATRSFGGTFVVRGLKSASGNDQICHKPVKSIADLSLDFQKKAKKTPKNKIQKKESKVTRRSTLSIRLLLKEFCEEFLNGSYNHLMRAVKDRLTRERGQENDEIYYLGAMRFFMEFNRYADSQFTVARVSETVSIVSFHYVQGLITNFHDLMTTDKENLTLWSKRAHTALRAYQELLTTLFVMDKTPETSEAARVIQSSIFYLPEYRELCVGLLTTYEGRKLSRNYLCDLVETNHTFLKMLEEFTREKKILVRGKKRGSRKSHGKKGKKMKTERKKTAERTEEDWKGLEEGLEEFLADGSVVGVEMIPFDAASEVAVDEQRGTAMSRIATHLGKQEFNEAVSLFRAAKDVWPDDDQVSKETEISSLKSIFLSAAPLPPSPNGEDDSEEDADDENEEDEIDEEEYEERDHGFGRESEFDFRGFVERYAHPKIIANYANLFQNYDSIEEGVLHCVMKMFHRLTFDLGHHALLCQASIFRTFQSLLKVAKFQPGLAVASDFFKHFWPKFVKLATGNPKMFMEILFWKSGKDSSEIENGYVPYSDKEAKGAAKTAKKNTRGTLTEEEENEICVLSEEFGHLPPEKGRKQVDWINERLINGPKVKKVIQNFLNEKRLLIVKQRLPKKGKKSRTRAEGLDAAFENLENVDILDSGDEGMRITSRSIVSSETDSDEEETSAVTARPTASEANDGNVQKVNSNLTVRSDSDDDALMIAIPRPTASSDSDGETTKSTARPGASLDSDGGESRKSSGRTVFPGSGNDTTKAKSRRVMISSDSEDDVLPTLPTRQPMEAEDSDGEATKPSARPTVSSDSGEDMTKAKSRRMVMSSDSEDEELPKPKPKLPADSDEEDAPKNTSRRILSSDSEGETEAKKGASRRIVSSDSDA